MSLPDPDHWAKADRCLAFDGLEPTDRMMLRLIRAHRPIDEASAIWLERIAKRLGAG